MEMELIKDKISNGINQEIEKNQNEFLESMIGKIIDKGVDLGIRKIFPDFIEENIIEMKDNLFEYGIKEGIDRTIKNTLETGRNIIGIVRGDFKNIEEMKNTLNNGKIIENISELIDYAIEKTEKYNLINNRIGNKIKIGKEVILSNIKKDIDKMFRKQVNSFKRIDAHIEKWRQGFEEKNYAIMKNEYKNINNILREILPINKTIRNINVIDNIQKLVENNNGIVELNEDELELANKFI